MKKVLPVIGSKFVGPNSHYDQNTKAYWAVLPPLSPDEVRLQRDLLRHDKGRDKKVAKAMAVAAAGAIA